MSQYQYLKVKEIIKETSEAITLVFENPDKEKLKYKPGQFLTFILNINGENVRRSYSLCTAYEVDSNPAVTVKRVVNGKVSNYLADKIKVGDLIELMQPMGTFTTEVSAQNKRTVVLIGAGSGITPLMGIAKSILVGEPNSKVNLIYGNRNEDSIIFHKQIEELKNKYSNFSVEYILSQPSSNWFGHKGRLSQSEIIKLLEDFPNLNYAQSEYFICGPEGMMEEAKNALEILRVPKDKIRKESFVTATSPQPSGKVVETGNSSTEEVTIMYSGTEYKFTVPQGKTILEAALDKNIDLPYSCQSGMCTACMGKCTSGKVRLDDPDGLSEKEISQGYVLTCVGYPVSGNIVIEID